MTTNSGFLAGVLAMCLSREDTKSIAFILSQLDPLLSAGVLNRLPEEMQGDVVVHMASGEFDESLSQEINAILLDEILDDAGGPKAAAEILNRTGRSTEKVVMAYLHAQNPELAEDVRNQMYTFDDIAKQTDREIQVILREIDTKDLAVALKGGSDELTDRIFSNISERVGTMIKEEMASSGPMRMSDVEDVQLRIVQTVRRLEEEGKVTIVRGEPDIWV